MVALELAGAVALWGASKLAWSWASFDGGVRGILEETVLGSERAPALVPLALLAVAGIAGLIATSGWARRVLCLVLLVAGAAACVVTGVDVAAVAGDRGGADGSGIQPGHGLALLGGLLVAAGGALGARAADRLPKLGERYDNPAAKAETVPAADTDEDLWNALSEGEDPTSRG
ncbi:MAG: hypothetical protein GEU86_16675 [Actinophytocola sp.]|nr:hypothetical protein [Actinophytocola sp.]